MWPTCDVPRKRSAQWSNSASSFAYSIRYHVWGWEPMILLRWPGTCAPRDRPGKRKSEGCVPKRRRIWPNRMQPPDESHLWDPILQAKLFSTKHKLFENEHLHSAQLKQLKMITLKMNSHWEATSNSARALMCKRDSSSEVPRIWEAVSAEYS